MANNHGSCGGATGAHLTVTILLCILNLREEWELGEGSGRAESAHTLALYLDGNSSEPEGKFPIPIREMLMMMMAF